MCESSEVSGETARMLRLISALTEKICRMYAHVCMCESSEGSGKTAHTLRLVSALTERIFRMYAHFVHV